MPEYLSPGVFIEELAGPKPIEGVGTSTGAFVGIAERGPVNSPQLITNLTQFADTFGGFIPSGFLAYAVQHFFTEGGTRCYVVRAFKPNAPVPGDPTPDIASLALVNAGGTALTVSANSPGVWGRRISVQAVAHGFDSSNPPDIAKRFRLNVLLDDLLVESFDLLSMNEFDATGVFPNANHIETRINGVSKFITVLDATKDPTKTDPPDVMPNPVHLGSGAVGKGGDGQALAAADLIGNAATAISGATGLKALDAILEINIVAIPDLVNPAFPAQDARDQTLNAIAYCDLRKDCFFVADAPSGLSPQAVLEYRRGSGGNTPATGSAFNSKFAALYYPWIFATDPLTGKRKLLPPSGAVAGSYAEADSRVGVHKAPAGTEDGFLNAAVEVERIVTKGEQDTLNPEGVNVIRKFPGAGIVIWGARTVSSDPEWKYVNVRRLFNFLEQSILKGTQGLVFEPNDPSLWKRITRDVSAFLRVQWTEGKIVGDKEEKAFFVRCNEETNTPDTIDLGQVITLIGICPSKPAEFVIFRIKQTRFGGDVQE